MKSSQVFSYSDGYTTHNSENKKIHETTEN